MLFARDDDLWRMRPDGGEEQRLSRGGAADWTGIGEIWEWANCCGPAVSPDGRWVVWTDGTSRSFLVDTAGPTQRVLLEQFAGFAWAPDSRTLAYLLPMERECAVHLYGLFDGNDECLIGQSEQWDIKRMVWSPDSRFIAYACYGQPVEPYTGTSRLEVRSVDVATRQVETVGEMEVHIASSTYLCWTADGQVVSGRAVPPGSVRCSPDLASRQTSPDGMRSLHTMDLQYARAPQTGWRVWVTANDAGEDAAPVWQREFPGPACTRVFWSVDGEYLLLDDREANSPIWRLRADGTGELERIVEDGFFIDVIAAWE